MKLRILALGALITFSLGFFLIARSAASWRPQIIGATPDLEQLQISPDGLHLLSNSAAPRYPDEEFQLWDIAARKVVHRLHAIEVWWSASGRLLVASQTSEDPNDDTVYYQQSLRIIEAANGKTRREWKQLPFRAEEVVNDARLENGDRELLVATPFRVWRLDVASGKILSRVNLQIQYQRDPQQSTPPNFQSFVDAGTKVFYCNVGDVFLLDAKTGKRLKKLDMREGSPILAPDGKTVLDFNWETGALRALDVSTGEVLWQQPAAGHPFFSPDGKILLLANETLRLLDARTDHLVRELNIVTPPGEQPQYALAPDGDFVFVSEAGKIIRYRIR